MLSKRALAPISIAAAAAAIVLLLAWLHPGTQRAAAVTGPDFSMAVAGPACHASDAGADCDITANSLFTVTVQLNKINLADYRGFQVELTAPSDLPFKNRPRQREIVWPDCEIAYDNTTIALTYQAGCTRIAGHGTSTYLGPVLEADYTCGASSSSIYTITMLQGSAHDATYLLDDNLNYVEPEGGPTKTLTIRCHGTPVRVTYGDANCDGSVNSIDAAVILQYSAALVQSLSCPQNADVNGDGIANALDAALILQYTAGLIPRLGPPMTPTAGA